MAQRGRRFAVIVGVLVFVPVLLFVCLWLYSSATYVSSKIVDFQPSDFQAKADAGFFYSIGDELRYSNELGPQSPILMRGQIKNFLVSPDNREIAVVANGLLTVVSRDGTEIRQVTTVDSIYRKPKPIGQTFFRDNDFQWSKDSKNLYLIKDEYYESKGSQLFSSKGELWKYVLETRSLQPVLKPFPAYSYFLGLKSGIYFSVPTDSGDLKLRYFDGNRLSDIDAPQPAALSADRLSQSFVELPFFSFSINDYEAMLPAKGVSLIVDQGGGPAKLEIGNKSYLTLTQGNGFKGTYYCNEMSRSVFLPGDRYFLFNVPDCGNYNGQLLIDTITGKYQRLPKDSRVYLTLNTDTISHYRITVGGILAR